MRQATWGHLLFTSVLCNLVLHLLVSDLPILLLSGFPWHSMAYNVLMSQSEQFTSCALMIHISKTVSYHKSFFLLMMMMHALADILLLSFMLVLANESIQCM